MTEIDMAVEEWDALRPPDGDPDYLVGGDEGRPARIQGLREFADLMESRPDLPMPRSIRLTIYVDGTAQERQAQLQYAADRLGEPIGPSFKGSDVLRTYRDFGPVKYLICAYPPAGQDRAPAFSVGQEVRLTADAAHVAETARLAQAGTVAGIEEAPDGTCTYTVHFPGRVGTQRGWTDGALMKAPPFDAVTLASGEVVSSLEAAEAMLIERGAEIKLQALSAHQPSETLLADHYLLASRVSEACGLAGGELMRQLEPQVEERVRGHVSAHGLEAPKTAPGLAASDGRHVTAAVEAVPAQAGHQPVPGSPVAAPKPGRGRRHG
jgi:hypothetical protein